MLTGSLTVVSSASLSLRRSFGVFFVFDKFDIRHLTARRRRDEEEESEDKAGDEN